ncbi:hypothetical protein [Roseovarius rhodophyticola]|uniref:Uncharacterized protein n=1 Tax=Roseovarius rhodophyticola TaxID=3080827 RepID=A0ABZ2TB89_9RHOB|nr:hypothetical protein [Roseovarius sp. W115]MDV2930653.1 hypothetical protein [Roseovarius sp. W115]
MGHFEFEPYSDDEKVTEQLKLFKFFNALKANGIVDGIATAFDGTLLERLNEVEGCPPDQPKYTSAKFKNINLTDYSRFTAGSDLCARIKKELHYVRIHSKDLQYVIEAYEFYYGEKFDPLPGDDYYLYRRPGIVEPISTTGEIRLNGDYVMYRVEQRRALGQRPPHNLTSQISLNFVRFFPHKNKGTRFMMLSLASYANHGDNRYLGAKGWVDNIEDRYLASGQIVSRNGQTVDQSRIHGGMSTLVVEAKQDMPFTLYKKIDDERYSIEAACCLHLRAVYGAEPSLARGYLVRCRGLEEYGGQDDQIQSMRYSEIRRLQQLLGEQTDADIELQDAASRLEAATGFATKAFYHKDENDHPHGLLVNLPFARDTGTSPFNLPIMLPSSDFPIWADNYPAKNVSDLTDYGVEFDLER